MTYCVNYELFNETSPVFLLSCLFLFGLMSVFHLTPNYPPVQPHGFLYSLSNLKCKSPMFSCRFQPKQEPALVQDK